METKENNNLNKKLTCSICGKEIQPNSLNWEYGNNAYPINNGRCCDDCEINIVLPRRLLDMRKEKKKNDK